MKTNNISLFEEKENSVGINNVESGSSKSSDSQNVLLESDITIGTLSDETGSSTGGGQTYNTPDIPIGTSVSILILLSSIYCLLKTKWKIKFFSQ
ncbi:hypothetical protein LJB92_03295 [Bacteroidales bacterium OttesenSCG-928-M06]|nr:hypothetical protein [Bacteroidales bacterium OttesenSCG-928-M06]